MGTDKSIVGVPIGAFIVNRYSNGWEIAQITGDFPDELVTYNDERAPVYHDGAWSALTPVWNFAICEGHPAHELLCAIAAAAALGGEPDELLVQAIELCNKELRNVGT